MAYTLLRRKIIVNNTGVGAPYSATNDWFDTVKRRPYSTQEDSLIDNPFELAEDTELLRYEYAPNKTRVVYYNGNGSVYTKNERATMGPISPTLKIKATPNVGVTDAARKDAYVDLTGQNGFPPYQVEVVGEQGPAKGFYQSGVSQSEIYPVRFYNLGVGQYTLRIRDATGDGRTQTLQIGVTQFGYPMGTILRDTIVRDRFIRLSWRGNELSGSVDSYRASQISGNYTIPYGTLVDGYLLPGSNGTIWRQVYAGYQASEVGPAVVYFVDTSTVAKSNLSLDNLILFNPDTTREQNGGALVEARGGTLPLRFVFTGPGVSKTNATGSIDGLGAGEYQVTVTDALGGEFTTSFKLTDRYRLWKYLDYDDLYSTPLRVELWRRDFDGEASSICGTDRPVVIKSDGLSTSLGGQGDLPPAVGRSAELSFLADIDLFEPVILGDDRNCRCDFYRASQLDFRGYVKPAIYTVPLLDGLQATSLTATDGLADLKTTAMLGHVGQRLSGHRPVLNTLLHCLSRCQISLPLQVYTNRRDATMATLDAPELFATTNRVGYYDDEKDEPDNQRAVLDADAQLLGGTLVQREGTWQIRSAQEAALPVAGRTYRPAGTVLAEAVAPAPAGAIRPPTSAYWLWLNGPPLMNIRPGWKSLVGTGDAGWLKNAFWQGEVFSDTQAWLDDYSQLRGTYGWRPPVGETFPLVLQRLGDKGKDHTTLWPRSQGLSMRDGRSLLSPPLPLAAGPEAVPAYLTITARFVATDFYLDDENKTVQVPNVAKQASLPYEVLVDGQSTGIQLATFELSKDGKDSTFEAPIPALPVGGNSAELRVYSWTAPDVGQLDSAYDLRTAPQPRFDKPALVKDTINGVLRLFIARRYDVGEPLTETYNWEEIPATNASSGQLLVSSIGIQLRPQEATWDGADTFRADGPGGTVRPTEPLKSYHVDVPLDAGLFAGNLDAFGKGVGSIDDAMATSWSRPGDLNDSPLLEANTFDGLALRANNARLLVGTVLHKGVAPPYLLDSVDAPSDVPGRRFLVGASTWDTRAAEVEVSLIEIGKGEGADFAWPDGARIVNRSYEFAVGRYVPYLRAVRGGIRVRG